MRTLAAAVILVSTQAAAQVGVTTWHNDLARTGANTQETTLTPANVNASSFGKLCAYAVDGQIYAQPLYVPGLAVGGTAHNVVFVATEHDSVYAFDADCSQAGALWHTSFLGDNITTMPCTDDKQEQCDVTIMSPEHGISPTPVIDTGANTIFSRHNRWNPALIRKNSTHSASPPGPSRRTARWSSAAARQIIRRRSSTRRRPFSAPGCCC